MAVRVFTLLVVVPLLPALLTVSAFAAKDVKFKDYPFEIARGERLVVQGVRGSVKLIALASGKTPVVRARKQLSDSAKRSGSEHFEELSFTVRREGGIVAVEIKGPTTRQEWIDWSRPGQPDLMFEIEAPATPAEIHLHTGSVAVSGWKDALTVTLQEGKIAVSDGEGTMNATALRGEIKIDRQKGNIDVESHAARVSIASSEGDVQIHNFAAETIVNTIKGNVSLRAKTGNANISKVDGGFDFDNGRGRIEGQGLDGAVRGQNDDGNISLQLSGEADVSIETQEGAVAVKPPGGAGVLLKLSSEDGAILAPSSVSVPRVSGPKSVVARLDGSPKGVIILRSKKGTIRIR